MGDTAQDLESFTRPPLRIFPVHHLLNVVREGPVLRKVGQYRCSIFWGLLYRQPTFFFFFVHFMSKKDASSLEAGKWKVGQSMFRSTHSGTVASSMFYVQTVEVPVMFNVSHATPFAKCLPLMERQIKSLLPVSCLARAMELRNSYGLRHRAAFPQR